MGDPQKILKSPNVQVGDVERLGQVEVMMKLPVKARQLMTTKLQVLMVGIQNHQESSPRRNRRLVLPHQN